MTTRMEEIVLFVSDVEAAARFYEEIIGLTRKRTGENFVVLDAGTLRLAFQSRELSAKHGGQMVSRFSPENSPLPFELSFDVADVDAAYERAIAAGGDPIEDPHDTNWGDRIAHLRDPNGVLIGLSRNRR
jgi:lactoylglutathione lyase